MRFAFGKSLALLNATENAFGIFLASLEKTKFFPKEAERSLLFRQTLYKFA